MYPAPATSNPVNPGTLPMAATSSSAILRGALRSVRASSKAIGKGIVAHLYLGRLFYREARNFYLELFQQDGAKTLKQNLSISAIHKSRPWALGRRGDLVAIR